MPLASEKSGRLKGKGRGLLPQHLLLLDVFYFMDLDSSERPGLHKARRETTQHQIYLLMHTLRHFENLNPVHKEQKTKDTLVLRLKAK